MKNEYYSNSNDYINRWVISYADFVTMLLALFMIMFATNHMDENKIKNVNQSIEKVFTQKTISEKTSKKIETETNQEYEKTQTNVKNIETKTDKPQIFESSTNSILEGGDGILEASKVMEQIKEDINTETSIKVLKTNKGVVIRLNDTMLFDPGSDIIKAEAIATLERIANTIAKFQNPIVIEGHTDSMPIMTSRFPSNWELSTARATNIIKYLIQQKKFPPSRLSAVGYGEYMPIEDNNTPQGRAKNRRVDIIVLSSDK